MRATAIFWATIIPIVFAAAVLYVIYKIRRTSQQRRQRSGEREAALLADLRATARIDTAAASGVPAVADSRRTSPAPSAAPAWARRPRILTDAQRALFGVLRAAMPEHLIMAHVRIVDLIDLPDASEAMERDARLRALARERLDFVVCDGDLAPVAAIVVYEPGIAQVPDESAKLEALRAIGVRFLRFRADSLPRPIEARNLILA